MNTKDLLTITAVAVGTATLTVATFLAPPLEAGSDADTLSATIPKPKLLANDIEMTLAPADGQIFKAGDQPAFELHAVNTARQPSHATVCVTMTSSSPNDKFSRLIRMPQVLWREERSLSLDTGESKAFVFSSKTNLPSGSLISVSLSRVDSSDKAPSAVSPTTAARINNPLPSFVIAGRGIVALEFSTVIPAAAPVIASKQ